MDRAAGLLQRAALSGSRAQMARLARIGVQWPKGDGGYMARLRQSVARCALDRLGRGSSQDLVRCGLLDPQDARPMQWDGFDPLCAMLMQPVCPERILMALRTTDQGQGAEWGRRLGEVGVRVIQAAGRLLGEYDDKSQEARTAWLGVVDYLLEMGMPRSARLSYAPVGMLSLSTDAQITKGLIDRGFDPGGPQGLVPPLALCMEPDVVRVLMAGGADCQVPAMNFIDDPVGRFGYIEREDTRIFARWCRRDAQVAGEILAAMDLGQADDEEIQDAILAIKLAAINSAGMVGQSQVAELLCALCLRMGMDRAEDAIGPHDSLQRREVMSSPGMEQGYLKAKACWDRLDMASRTPLEPGHVGAGARRL